MNQTSLKYPDSSLCFARCEFDCGVRLTNANYTIISVDSPTNPSQSPFNHFEDAEPLFRHMVPHSPVHAWSRADFIKRESQRAKFCTEARDSVLKPEHTIGSCRSSPEVRSQRSPWFLAQPLLPLQRAILYWILLVWKILSEGDSEVTRAASRAAKGKRGGFKLS